MVDPELRLEFRRGERSARVTLTSPWLPTTRIWEGDPAIAQELERAWLNYLQAGVPPLREPARPWPLPQIDSGWHCYMGLLMLAQQLGYEVIGSYDLTAEPPEYARD